MWVGLDANAANATNRVGAVFQTTSAISSLPKTKRVRYMIKQSYFIVPQLLSELFSGQFSRRYSRNAHESHHWNHHDWAADYHAFNPKKWLIPTDGTANKRTPKIWLAYLGLGFYGGFIQMGFESYFYPSAY